MIIKDKPIGTVAYLGGLPCNLEKFTWSWGQMIQFTSEDLPAGEYIHLDRATMSFHAYARNTLAERMLGDWILMLDTDHEFEPDLCVRMLNRLNVYNADVVTGFYQHKSYPYLPVHYLKNEQGFYSVIGKWESDGNSEIFQVDSTGAGCLMVRRRVFDRIRDELHESPFDLIPPFGEDHSFARRCEKLGIKILCDPRIQCKHLSVEAIGIEKYDPTGFNFANPKQMTGYYLKEDV